MKSILTFLRSRPVSYHIYKNNVGDLQETKAGEVSIVIVICRAIPESYSSHNAV